MNRTIEAIQHDIAAHEEQLVELRARRQALDQQRLQLSVEIEQARGSIFGLRNERRDAIVAERDRASGVRTHRERTAQRRARK